jgi:hypothetical protein
LTEVAGLTTSFFTIKLQPITNLFFDVNKKTPYKIDRLWIHALAFGVVKKVIFSYKRYACRGIHPNKYKRMTAEGKAFLHSGTWLLQIA